MKAAHQGKPGSRYKESLQVSEQSVTVQFLYS